MTVESKGRELFIVQSQSAREVAQLQEWFEAHWKDATEVTDAVIETISRHTRPCTPFDVYAKALQEFFRGHELTATEWDETRFRMFPKLDRYQQEAYWALMKIARRHGRAFLLCYALPALDREKGEFTEAAGTTRWYLYDLDRDAILVEPGEIGASIRSKPDTPRACTMEQKTLV